MAQSSSARTAGAQSLRRIFTFANVARVAQATADFWSANPVAGTKGKSSPATTAGFCPDRLRKIAAEVFAGNDFQVVLTPEPTPTPSVSFAVKAQRAIGGVMITASHNPPIFNGFKLKSDYGAPATPKRAGGRRFFGS